MWSADAKPVAVFTGVTDDAARVVYVPLTHSYWQPDRMGHIQAYDARAPVLVTEFVQVRCALCHRFLMFQRGARCSPHTSWRAVQALTHVEGSLVSSAYQY